MSTKPDAHVDGFISNTSNISFVTNVSCDGSPTGSISGTVRNVFTGSSTLSTFTFSSSSPILLGTLLTPTTVHVVFDNVTVKNTTTGQTFTGGRAVLTAEKVSSNSWEGSITVFFGSHTLTFFGKFAGNVTVNRQVICQELL